MRRPRHLSPEERELWDRVAARTERLAPEARVKPPLPKPVEVDPPTRFAPEPFVPGSTGSAKAPSHDLLPPLGARLRAAPVTMDAKSFGKMSRGKLKPEARIDLHGMTLDEAHPVLTDFILRSRAAGRRLVLVITGKGKRRDDGGPMPGRQGILRHQVPQWLALPPLAGAVLELRPAHLRHGGDGAYYVYLRRMR